MPDTLTLRQINRATLARQFLLARARTTPLRAVERLVAMQAQWPRPPFVGLWSRLEGFGRADLTALLERRQVVRATFIRATLHVVTARDFLRLRPTLAPALEGALRAVLRARAASFEHEALLARARTLLAGHPRTFEELRDAFVAATPGADVRAMGYAVRMLLPLVQVPAAGEAWGFPANARFALADEWLDRPIPPAATDGRRTLVERYLAGYGPASIADIQAWSGMPGLAEVVAAIRPRLRVFRDEQGRELFDLPDAERPPADMPVPVRFVPEYDNLITARADERFVARGQRRRVFLSALRIAATVLVDGFTAATWTLDRKKGVAAIAIAPFRAFPRAVRSAVVEEGEALLRFIEPDARSHEVRIGDGL